jgi:hypothetical protein
MKVDHLRMQTQQKKMTNKPYSGILNDHGSQDRAPGPELERPHGRMYFPVGRLPQTIRSRLVEVESEGNPHQRF